MSYDVTAGGEWFNYTSNMHRFFKDFGAYPGDWEGRSRYEVADELDVAIKQIQSNDLDALKREYDAPNEWGEVGSATQFLRKVRDACRRELPVNVEVSR